TTGMDTNLKAFAAKTLPTLQEHLRMAEELQRGGTTSSAKASSTSTKSTAEHAEHAEDASTKTKKKVTSTDSGATPQATEPKQTTDPKP
ncbi:MAG TPA: hypothetical protein VMZ52_10495, partial [Bryobacteraceae bacterium]|nr:hypothetical protein [Bryobacteraceae bacterium]